MVLQIFVHLFTRDGNGMAVVANFALTLVRGDMPVVPIAIAIAIMIISFRCSCHDLVLQIGTRLNGCGDIGSRIFLIHTYQNGGNSIKKLICVRLLHGLGSARSNGLVYLFRRGGQQPTSYSHEQARDERDDYGGEPITGGFGFHVLAGL
ncbi:MAG: hypothetical protein H0X34_04670 [Chthoniobacterales bacterium]|nr:hypothetical protein [Chthoniobacterales bacterium]